MLRTLGYDTIYGFQDIKDDEIIGLKSTSIKFKKIPYTFINICYSIFFISLVVVGYLMDLNNYYFFMLALIFFHLFIFQVKKLQIKNPENCLKIFRSNNFLGLLVFSSLFLGRL